MGSDPKPAAPGPSTPAKHENAAPHHKPWIGADVWYFDETQNSAFARMGIGPYAAKVTRLDVGGVSLFVIGPQGGRFDRENIMHKTQLGDVAGKKRWWEWPSRG